MPPQSIDLGLGLGTVTPLVLGPAVVPEITDPADAEAEMETELAVLSAVAHGNGAERAHRGPGGACTDGAPLDRWIDNVLGETRRRG